MAGRQAGRGGENGQILLLGCWDANTSSTANQALLPLQRCSTRTRCMTQRSSRFASFAQIDKFPNKVDWLQRQHTLEQHSQAHRVFNIRPLNVHVLDKHLQQPSADTRDTACRHTRAPGLAHRASLARLPRRSPAGLLLCQPWLPLLGAHSLPQHIFLSQPPLSCASPLAALVGSSGSGLLRDGTRFPKSQLACSGVR